MYTRPLQTWKDTIIYSKGLPVLKEKYVLTAVDEDGLPPLNCFIKKY